jgi:hypothetical protein
MRYGRCVSQIPQIEVSARTLRSIIETGVFTKAEVKAISPVQARKQGPAGSQYNA